MGWLRDTVGRLGAGAPAASPGDAASLLSRGSALIGEEQFEPAVEALERAVAIARPGDGTEPHALQYLLGRAYAGLGRWAPASIHFEAAVRAKADYPEALDEGARVLGELESHDEAADWLQRLQKLRPTTATRLRLAGELAKCDRLDDAAVLLRKVCTEEPRNSAAALAHHHVMVKLGRFQDALTEIDRVLKLRKPDAWLLVHRAVTLGYLGRHKEALASVGKALVLDPTHARALANRATLLLTLMRVPEAIAAAEEGLRVHPDEPDLHWSRGGGLMLLGDFERGWPEFEWRTRTHFYEGTVPDFQQPRWQGESLAGRTILLYAEQGFGDAIQFLRFVPELARKAGTVLLMLWPELEALAEPSLPANCRIVSRRPPLPAFDFHCPLMSIPAVLGTTLATLPADVPYLRSPPAAVQEWRQRLGSGRLNVGICWSGNPRHLNDGVRSMSLGMMRGVAVDSCRFFALQPNKRPGDAQALAGWRDAVDLGPELHDFRATAALIEALDLVITVDTAIAHLAGALGKPVWILLAYSPEWRWMLERDDSPWYPTARLYRQRSRGDWGPVLARARKDLAALAAR